MRVGMRTCRPKYSLNMDYIPSKVANCHKRPAAISSNILKGSSNVADKRNGGISLTPFFITPSSPLTPTPPPPSYEEPTAGSMHTNRNPGGSKVKAPTAETAAPGTQAAVAEAEAAEAEAAEAEAAVAETVGEAPGWVPVPVSPVALAGDDGDSTCVIAFVIDVVAGRG